MAASGTATPRKKTMSTRHKGQDVSEVSLSVLGYREGQEWIALALEMDLRGYGETMDDAIRELNDLVAMQLSFARFKSQPELAWKPAEPQYWTLFANAQRDQLLRFATSSTNQSSAETEARTLPVPPPNVMAELSEFQQANA